MDFAAADVDTEVEVVAVEGIGGSGRALGEEEELRGGQGEDACALSLTYIQIKGG